MDLGFLPPAIPAIDDRPDPEWAKHCVGRSGRFTMGYDAAPVLDMGEIAVGDWVVRQSDSPQRTKHVFVYTPPGHHPADSIEEVDTPTELPRPGRWFTLVERELTIPDRSTAGLLRDLSNEAKVVLGLVVTQLDDRIARDLRFEHLTVEIGSPKGPIFVSQAQNVATWSATRRIETATAAALGALAVADPKGHEYGPGRWFLQGCRLGPSIEGFMALCIAIDVLTDPDPSSMSRFKLADLRAAAAEVSVDLSDRDLQAIAGIRGTCMHNGRANMTKLRDAYYNARWLAHKVLRQRIGGPDESVWPVLQPPDG